MNLYNIIMCRVYLNSKNHKELNWAYVSQKANQKVKHLLK